MASRNSRTCDWLQKWSRSKTVWSELTQSIETNLEFPGQYDVFETLLILNIANVLELTTDDIFATLLVLGGLLSESSLCVVCVALFIHTFVWASPSIRYNTLTMFIFLLITTDPPLHVYILSSHTKGIQTRFTDYIVSKLLFWEMFTTRKKQQLVTITLFKMAWVYIFFAPKRSLSCCTF